MADLLSSIVEKTKGKRYASMNTLPGLIPQLNPTDFTTLTKKLSDRQREITQALSSTPSI
jgi:hypothetical protein